MSATPQGQGKANRELTLQLLFDKQVHIHWVDFVQELDVLVRVELGHLALRGWFGSLTYTSRSK